MKKAIPHSKAKQIKYNLIRTEKQFDRYVRLLNRLHDEDRRKYQKEIELLDLLTDRWITQKMKNDDPVKILRYVVCDKYRMSHMAKDLGISKGHMSDILNYMKPLSKKLILKISIAWNLPTDLLARPYPLRTKRVKKPKLTEIDW